MVAGVSGLSHRFGSVVVTLVELDSATSSTTGTALFLARFPPGPAGWCLKRGAKFLRVDIGARALTALVGGFGSLLAQRCRAGGHGS